MTVYVTWRRRSSRGQCRFPFKFPQKTAKTLGRSLAFLGVVGEGAMNRSVFLAIGLTSALAIVASPAAAQHRRGGGESRGDGGGNSSPRAEQRAERQAPQPQQQQQQQA